jgi:hypothetical protein
MYNANVIEDQIAYILSLNLGDKVNDELIQKLYIRIPFLFEDPIIGIEVDKKAYKKWINKRVVRETLIYDFINYSRGYIASISIWDYSPTNGYLHLSNKYVDSIIKEFLIETLIKNKVYDEWDRTKQVLAKYSFDIVGPNFEKQQMVQLFIFFLDSEFEANMLRKALTLYLQKRLLSEDNIIKMVILLSQLLHKFSVGIVETVKNNFEPAYVNLKLPSPKVYFSVTIGFSYHKLGSKNYVKLKKMVRSTYTYLIREVSNKS